MDNILYLPGADVDVVYLAVFSIKIEKDDIKICNVNRKILGSNIKMIILTTIPTSHAVTIFISIKSDEASTFSDAWF